MGARNMPPMVLRAKTGGRVKKGLSNLLHREMTLFDEQPACS